MILSSKTSCVASPSLNAVDARSRTAPKLDRRFAEIVREIQACSRIEAEIFEQADDACASHEPRTCARG